MNKQFLKYIIFFLSGAFIGGGGVILFYKNNQPEHVVQKIIEEKVVKEKVTDTIIVEKNIYLDTISQIDSAYTEIFSVDTLRAENNKLIDSTELTIDKKIDTNSNEDEEDIIITEKLISKRNVMIQIKETDSIDVSTLLNLKAESFAYEMLVEFWESPLELTGYELSRNKMKLFGFNPSDSISIIRKLDEEILDVRIGDFNLKLEKTTRFKTLNL